MASPGMWVSPTRLYVNKDRSKVVPEDSPEAAFVLVGAGSELLLSEAVRLGLVKVTEGRVHEIEAAPVVTPVPEPVAAEAVVTEPAVEHTSDAGDAPAEDVAKPDDAPPPSRARGR